ncbi:uncharacterized protein [Aegilops tauschii subsp. strangulata]|uniref:Ubiquitin-like protease family profile domain-containing protein n=4 Tax=Aegilops tauschii subsp. strangulata TaxID=200361 RepID=A0A453MDT1_AEGTS|nr:probable ubiquitin-like-specific protease 2B [Aegilops tauschii subsp. strangulata]
MNQTEISGLEFTGLHDTHVGEESYATEFPEMNQDLSHKTEFDVVMATTAMHSGSGNSYACLDGYEDTRMMSGIQAVKEVRHGSTQHLEGTYSDSDEENLSSSPETSSTTNYGYMEPNLENMYNALGEMVDKEGAVVLKPDFVMCDTALHYQPHLIFSPDGFKIEHSDCDPYEDDKTIALCWDVCDIISINSQWTQSVISASVTLLIRPSAETESSDPIRVEFILTDPQWPRKQEKICHMASRYRDIWNNTPSEDFALENRSTDPSLFFPKQYFSGIDDFEDVIYPKGDPDAVSISSRDVDLLLPETFVNDTIIDFYIKYLSTRMKTTEKSKYHFFNSFFFRKLADLDKDQGRAPEGRSAFLRVRKWTRKINIFAKDFLFIPVNFSLHWSLIVICYPGEVETSEDGEAKKHGKVPCILHMDSLKGNHSGLKDIIQSYLWEEWKERHPESALDISDKFLNLRFVSLELPQQDNSFDCGLFLLHYVERFLMDYPSSFNPMKISVSSTFLSDGWFEPAEASLKRSLIRKLIQELVTVPSQTFPELTCGSEQFDESYLGRENAEPEAAREFLAQGCSAGESDSLCQIPGTQQQSTSVCFNDSGNVLPVPGCILETEGVTTFAVQDTQVCPPDNDIAICMPSQAVENEPPPADYDNKPDLRSCAPEDDEALKDDGCVVKGQDTFEESMLDCSHNNQTISSHAEVMMHDIMDSKCGSFSINSAAMAYKEQSLETSINEVLYDCCDVSEDMDPVMMSDAREVDIAPDPASTKDEADNGRCDLPDVMGSVVAGDIEGNTSEHSSERNIIEDEEAKGDISLIVCDLNNDVAEQSSPVVCDLNNDVAEHSPATIAVESEDAKHEETSVDLKVEDDIEVGMEETCAAADKISDGMRHISPESKEGNIDSAVPHEPKEGETSSIVSGDSKNWSDEAHVDSVDAHGNVGPGAGETVPCEVDTNHTDAEMPDIDSALCVKNETVCEDTPCDAKRPLPDGISKDQKMEVCEDKPNEAVWEDKPRDAKRALLASTSEDQKMVASEDKPNEAVSEDKPCDAKRPRLASTSEDQKMQVSEDRCSEDVESTAEKTERRNKRRKGTVPTPTPATDKRRTRSSSMPRFLG